MTDDEARSSILARRSRFVALALAAVGCHGGEAPPPKDTVELPPSPDAGAPIAHAEPDAGHATATVDAEAAPTGISPETRARYTKLATRVAEMLSSIDVVGAKVAKTPAFTSARQNEWRDLVGEVQNLYFGLVFLDMYCPDPPRPETVDFLAAAHREASRVRNAIDAVKTSAETKLADKTTKGSDRYDTLLALYDQANPRPCLSFACDRW